MDDLPTVEPDCPAIWAGIELHTMLDPLGHEIPTVWTVN